MQNQQSFTDILDIISDKVNKAPSNFSKFQILSTFTQVVLSRTAVNLIQTEGMDSALRYITKFASTHEVPAHYAILKRAGFVIVDSPRGHLIMASRGKGLKYEVKEDPIGSGAALIKTAAIVMASKHDGCHYEIGFNVDTRRRFFEIYATKAGLDLTYDNYVLGVKAPDVEYADIDDIFDEEGELDLTKIDNDFNVSSFLVPDDVQEILDHIRGREIGFTCKMRGRDLDNLDLNMVGFTLVAQRNLLTFRPVIESKLAKGPEHPEEVEALISFLESNSTAKVDEKLVIPVFEPKNELATQHKERVAAPVDVSRAHLDVDEDNASEASCPVIDDDRVKVKYTQVRHAYEKNKALLQINRDKILPRLSEFTGLYKKSPDSLRRAIKDLRNNAAGKTFEQVVKIGSDIVIRFLQTSAYLASAAARRVRAFQPTPFNGRDIFLDFLINGQSQFPDMELVNGKYKFQGMVTKASYDERKDPFVRNLRQVEAPLDPTFDEAGSNYSDEQEFDEDAYRFECYEEGANEERDEE